MNNQFFTRKKIILIIFVLFFGFIVYKVGSTANKLAHFSFGMSGDDDSDSSVRRKIGNVNEILHLEINGVIMNGKKFLAQLKKYSKEKTVKAIVIEINSPGGAVGPSQEIYTEIMRTKKETGKPVVCVSTGLIASGGYYSALACDKIVVAPGTMIGSIGVIMEFANLEELYSWAKVKRYTITSGKFKDSGSEYRAMREDEKQLFQDMINEVYEQFKGAVAESRQLPIEEVAKYADGRVMTGATAVKLKFADEIGTYEDAVRLAAKEAKLKEDDYEIYKPRRNHPQIFDMLFSNDEEDDDLNSQYGSTSFIDKFLAKLSSGNPEEVVKRVLKVKMMNQPMMIMPGYWE